MSTAFKSLKALTKALDDHKSTDKDNFDSWAEDGELIWSGSHISTHDDSLLLWRQKYTAVFSFENFTGKPENLFLIVMNYLQSDDCDHDADELGHPTFDADMVGNDAFDVEITINFEDEVTGKETADGFILMDAEIVTAETVSEVNAGIGCGT